MNGTRGYFGDFILDLDSILRLERSLLMKFSEQNFYFNDVVLFQRRFSFHFRRVGRNYLAIRHFEISSASRFANSYRYTMGKRSFLEVCFPRLYSLANVSKWNER